MVIITNGYDNSNNKILRVVKKDVGLVNSIFIIYYIAYDKKKIIGY